MQGVQRQPQADQCFSVAKDDRSVLEELRQGFCKQTTSEDSDDMTVDAASIKSYTLSDRSDATGRHC